MSEKNLIRIIAVSVLIAFVGILGLVYGTASSDTTQNENGQDLLKQVNSIQTENSDDPSDQALKNQQYTQGNSAQTKTTDEAVLALLNAKPLTAIEIESVRSITKMLSLAINQELSSQSFIKLIKTSGLLPKATVQENDDTGNMTTVRTSNSLVGTRYFHAQFFGGEKLKDFPQHISFEIRPGKDSLEVAGKMIEENFGAKAKLVESRSDYKRWKTEQGQVIWAKVMDAEDVEDSPINPRTKADIGAVWVAIEDDIHEDGHDEDHD